MQREFLRVDQLWTTDQQLTARKVSFAKQGDAAPLNNAPSFVHDTRTALRPRCEDGLSRRVGGTTVVWRGSKDSDSAAPVSGDRDSNLSH